MNLRESTPLVVDLDGTLIKTDTLFESANAFAWTTPLAGFHIVAWLARGKGTLKSRLAERINLDVEHLPFNGVVVDYVRSQRAAGRKTVLATASDHRYATAISEYLGLFDEVLASNEALNLKSSAKAELLRVRFGESQYEYVGDARADLPVWNSAEQATLVDTAKRFAKKIRANVPVVELDLGARPNVIRKSFKLLRFHQWAKNLLIFLPLLAAHQFVHSPSLFSAFAGFIAFGLAASSIYIVNDLIDLPHDRRHATKNRRMLAAGDVSVAVAWILWPALLAAGMLISVLLVNLLFTLVLGFYILITLAYSLFLKRLPIFDVVTLAGLYTIRIVAGAAAIAVPLSFWILTFAMFLFLSLALMKRFSELKEVRETSAGAQIGGRGYIQDDLELVSSFGAGSGLIAVLVFMLYVQDPKIAPLYASPSTLWLTGPLLLTWIARAWLIAHRGDMHEDPIVFAIRDKFSYLIGALMVAAFMAATVF